MIEYIRENYGEILVLFAQHIGLTVLTIAIAFGIALPLGVILSKHDRISSVVLAGLSIVYTIPSLALFAMLLPLVGLGVKPAVIALVCYSQLILVRNVVAGFKGIDPAAIEAGKGLGYNAFQLFFRVELVIAMPVILGGLRIATTSVIAIATIASWINAGGLGVMLFEGLSQSNTPEIICGTVLVSALALVVNKVLVTLEKRAQLRMRGELQAAK
ncbi:ABC transporter permease [Ethanoligenens sp.]|uniref:ABC transporter permease n=1 Tax=Ethanoligenens sp. TaxID=2099655 RepID=UPI0039E91AD8